MAAAPMPELSCSAASPPSDEGQRALDAVKRFLTETARPMIKEFSRDRPNPAFALEPDGTMAAWLAELKKQMQQESARAGLYCPQLPRSEGGLGLSLVDCFHVQEEVFRHGLSGAQWMLAWTDGPDHLLRYWSAEANERYRDEFLAGRTNMASAVTEPTAGSDFLALEASAKPDGDGWLLNGNKYLITGAPLAEFVRVFARIEGAARDRLTLFLLPMDAPGVERGPAQATIMADGNTGEIRFNDVRVDRSSLIGDEHGALELSLLSINWILTRRGGMCSGLARHCLDAALTHAGERRAYGRPIIELGTVAEMISDMYMDWLAMRALSLEILTRLDGSGIFDMRVTEADTVDLAVIKTWNDEALYRIADRAIQVMGGRGVLTETGIEKIFRVARNLRIPAGTSEAQRATISRLLNARAATPD